MTDINRVRTDIPFAEAIKKFQENDNTILSLAEADKIDYLDIIDIMSGTGNKSRFERNTQLGHSLTNYTSWSGVSNEAGYTVWRYPLTNFADHTDNKLYLDDVALDYRGIATSESTTAFDLVYVKSGSTYTNNTVEAGTTQGTSFGLMASNVEDLYIGDADVFGGIDFNFDILGYNYNLDVYYFNGAWTELSTTTDALGDDTLNFSSSGRVTWDLPTDWISGTFNSQNKRWVKISTTTTPVTVARAYHVMPVDSVINKLSLSSDDIFDKKWAWCHFNDNLYVTLKNAGGVGYEGREWITRDSTDTNKQNYFVYNHELKTTYQRDDFFAPQGIGEQTPRSGTLQGLRVVGKSSFGDDATLTAGKKLILAPGEYIGQIDGADRIDFYCGSGRDMTIGTTYIDFADNDLRLQTTKAVTLDGGDGHSKIAETSDNNITITATGIYRSDDGANFDQVSDIRLKENIQPLASVMCEVMKLRPSTFAHKTDGLLGHIKGIQKGFIADFVEDVYPEWVTLSSNGYKTINYKGVYAILFRAIQELKIEIDEIKDQIKTIREKR